MHILSALSMASTSCVSPAVFDWIGPVFSAIISSAFLLYINYMRRKDEMLFECFKSELRESEKIRADETERNLTKLSSELKASLLATDRQESILGKERLVVRDHVLKTKQRVDGVVKVLVGLMRGGEKLDDELNDQHAIVIADAAEVFSICAQFQTQLLANEFISYPEQISGALTNFRNSISKFILDLRIDGDYKADELERMGGQLASLRLARDEIAKLIEDYARIPMGESFISEPQGRT